ncbi:putative Glutaredoxin-C6 [Nannochloris sp. 'desiccata']|nr:putative Glutaredoxin-C6 [Chlorella desiccata (nom. nud.)]
MRASVLLALAVVGLTIYKFTFNSDDALPGASRVADEQVLSGVEGIVKGYLKGNRVVVFSKSYCGHSRRAKSIMERHLGSTGFKVVELDQREDGSDIQDYLLELTGGRTVPRVFIDGAFIGGADDTAALEGTGKLKTMLVQKGIL